MRPWASWTAKTALLAAGFAAAGGGLSGVALAGTGGSSTSGNASVLSGDQLIAPVGRGLRPQCPKAVAGQAAGHDRVRLPLSPQGEAAHEHASVRYK